MSYKSMVVFLEGLDDDRFFGGIIKPILDDKYDHVKSVQYANKKPEELRKYLRSIKATVGADYLFWGDINSSPCITAKKQDLRAKFGKVLDHDKILIVIKEIESWYLAGLNDTGCKMLGIKVCSSTNDITKERFKDLTPKKFNFRVDFMREILSRFSVGTARRKNKSFCYFMSKVQKLS
jgi:hypothetical protein